MLEGARWLKGSSISGMHQKATTQSALEPDLSPKLTLLAVQVMNEVGVDISSQKSKIITEDMIRSSAKSVNMGCIERAECPLLFMNNVIDWGIEDPKGKSIEKVREIRDEIDRRVIEIAQSLQGQDSS
jgi:protein-tyrosine-phosphatase